MTSWQGAMALLRFEGRQSWGGLLITMAFFTYIGVVMMPLFNDVLVNGESEGYAYRWVGDFLYLTILPTMGFLMNRRAFFYRSRDSYTRKLAYWRTLPIGWNAIVLSRMLQHAVVLTIVSAYFFTVEYALLNELRALLAPGEYILYALTWYGYALAAGSTYVYFEQTLKGKIYFAVCIGYMLVYALLCLLLWATGTNLFMRTIEASREHHYIWPVVALLLGTAVSAANGLFIRNRLRKRSLLQ